MTWMDILMLENLIIEKKAQLLNIVELHGLNHLKTIQCSQELDHLLNLHERIKYGSM
ncbi:Spo0E family sporulation regulatory protein-aspartic acid phosphatase [Peribacillus sp. NPDC096622]|uniref:Spo0E family sporulation regulatory protein-aspartic acid phosphatase n=1 Tax=Peribacillus sp. NPDC096622 TaxID=3364396 RepID=UPI0037FB1272